MNKREICRFIEKLGGSFNTDLRLWIIENKHSGLLMDYLKNNGIKYGKSKDGFFRIVTDKDHIIYVKAIKLYRKPKNAYYRIMYMKNHCDFERNASDYINLKNVLKEITRYKDAYNIRIFDSNNKAVCKKLWS